MYVYTYTYTYISIYLFPRQQSLSFSLNNSCYHDLCDSKVSACKSRMGFFFGTAEEVFIISKLTMMYIYVTTTNEVHVCDNWCRSIQIEATYV